MAGWTVIEPAGVGRRAAAREFWRSRRLIRYFGGKLVEKVTVRSRLGVLWIPLRPLLTVATRALVFGGVLNAPSEGLPYFLFFLTGMAVWDVFDRTLFWATRSIELNARLLRKMYFPRLLLPASALVPAALDFAVYCVLVVLAIAGFSIADGHGYLQVAPALLIAAAGLVLIAAMAVGFGLLLSVLGAFTRDVRFSLSYVLGFWFFLTPVVYPVSAIPAAFRDLAAMNPLSAPIEMVRNGLYGTGQVQPGAVVVACVTAAVALAIGFLFFSRWESESIDSL
jgi:lipopolysaccharide transport system permease protein